MRFSQKMPLYFFYTMVQKSKKMTRNSNQGGPPRGSFHLAHSVVTVLIHLDPMFFLSSVSFGQSWSTTMTELVESVFVCLSASCLIQSHIARPYHVNRDKCIWRKRGRHPQYGQATGLISVASIMELFFTTLLYFEKVKLTVPVGVLAWYNIAVYTDLEPPPPPPPPAPQKRRKYWDVGGSLSHVPHPGSAVIPCSLTPQGLWQPPAYFWVCSARLSWDQLWHR